MPPPRNSARNHIAPGVGSTSSAASTARPTTMTLLTVPDYDVLSNLAEAPDQRGRLSELAARMLWSQSRLSHHISRMEQRGLVTREECKTDARGSVVVLTKQGQRTLEKAAPHHVES